MEPSKVVLGGIAYEVRPLSLPQRRRIDVARAQRLANLSNACRAAISTGTIDAATISSQDVAAVSAAHAEYRYDLVTIAMERATPRPMNGDAIEATAEEFDAAFAVIEAANYPKTEAAPQVGEA